MSMNEVNFEKVFKREEIESYLNNQIRRQHLKERGEEEEWEGHTAKRDDDDERGGHLILVTQNGDKIILIQQEGAAATEVNDDNVTEQRSQLDDEETIRKIHEKHRIRQKELLMQMNSLKRRNDDVETDVVRKRSTLLTSGQSSVRRPAVGNQTQRWSPSVSGLMAEINRLRDEVKTKRYAVGEIRRMFPLGSNAFKTRINKVISDFDEFIETDLGAGDRIRQRLGDIRLRLNRFLRDYHLESGLIGIHRQLVLPDGLTLTLDEENESGNNSNNDDDESYEDEPVEELREPIAGINAIPVDHAKNLYVDITRVDGSEIKVSRHSSPSVSISLVDSTRAISNIWS